MVYKLFDEESAGSSIGTTRRRPTTRIRLPQWDIHTESKWANSIVKALRLLLLVYDLLTWPIYFFIQRPDRRARDAQQIRSERVDINTWIRTDPSPNRNNYSPWLSARNGIGPAPAQNGVNSLQQHGNNHKIAYRYMGATMSEIFAKALEHFGSRQCLGYRAVVTCPVLCQNELGQHVMQDKSFRSDYTWYTYEQIGRRVHDLASGLYHHSMYPGSRALFLASTCLEWFCAAQACFQLASEVVIAPAQLNNTNDGDDSLLRLIINETGLDAIFVSCDKLTKLCQLFKSMRAEEENEPTQSSIFHIRQVIIIDWQFAVDFNEPAFAQLQEAAGNMVERISSMGQVEEVGIESPIELCCTRALRETDTDDGPSASEVTEVAVPNRGSRMIESLVSGAPLTSPTRRRNRFASEQLGQAATSEYKSIHAGERSLSVKPHYGGSSTLTRRSISRASSPRLSLNDLPKSISLQRTRARPDDVAMIVYTHGSLGLIQPLVLSHSYLARSSHYLFLDGMVSGDDVHCSSLALDNVIEFMTEMCIFSHGGSIGYSSNLETLFYDGKELFKRDRSDLEALSPSFLLLRPYILESLRTSVQNYLSFEMNPLASFLLTNVIFDYKKYWARRHFGTPIVDKLFCSHPKRLFGSRMKYIFCDGATDCTETKDFFAFMLNIPVIELYGPEEALVSMLSVNDIWDYKRRRKQSTARRWFQVPSLFPDKQAHQNEADEERDFFKNMQLLPPKVNRNTFREDSSKNLLITSSILCPTLSARIRLDDWEDFRTSDLPYPRGRLMIGGNVVCRGYFKRAELNKQKFHTDSNSIVWFCTNDIARVFPNGSFEIISAMSDMMKMIDGQFISLSQIEHLLRNSQFVDNVCVICGEDRRLVIALVVPNLRRLALKSPGEANLKSAIAMEPEPEELVDVEFRREVCNDRLLAEFVSGHLTELMEKAGMQAVAKRFLLVPEIWTPESELVTPAFEPKRAAIQKFYAADIQSIFKMEFPSKSNKMRLSSRLANGRSQT